MQITDMAGARPEHSMKKKVELKQWHREYVMGKGIIVFWKVRTGMGGAYYGYQISEQVF